MPLYAYHCPSCGRDRDDFNTVAERLTNAPECCDTRMGIQIQPVRGSVQADCNYECPVTNQRVTSWAQRKNIMSERGLVDARDVKPEFVFRKARERKARRDALIAGADLPAGDLSQFIPQAA